MVDTPFDNGSFVVILSEFKDDSFSITGTFHDPDGEIVFINVDQGVITLCSTSTEETIQLFSIFIFTRKIKGIKIVVFRSVGTRTSGITVNFKGEFHVLIQISIVRSVTQIAVLFANRFLITSTPSHVKLDFGLAEVTLSGEVLRPCTLGDISISLTGTIVAIRSVEDRKCSNVSINPVLENSKGYFLVILIEDFNGKLVAISVINQAGNNIFQVHKGVGVLGDRMAGCRPISHFGNQTDTRSNGSLQQETRGFHFILGGSNETVKTVILSNGTIGPFGLWLQLQLLYCSCSCHGSQVRLRGRRIKFHFIVYVYSKRFTQRLCLFLCRKQEQR
mmetsp:Transcript_39241/g.94910  ORF Transcript_39241/g.94910 Transcript_39241/m.94910 type:complete len:333 (-) Transcript_39241:311-1309(-)